jgi:hypothetical protein
MSSGAEEFFRNEAVEVDMILRGKKEMILAGVEKEIL